MDREGLPSNLPSRIVVVSELGRGGTGTVWRARDRQRGRDVALKVLDVGDGAVETRLARLEREIRALARLGGRPGLAAVIAAGRDRSGRLWMIRDLVEGSTVQESILSDGPDPARAADLLAALAPVLAAVHSVDIIHGDITPANIVLSESGPVLVDFGVGGLDGRAGPGPGAADGTTDGAHSPAYAAPERLRGLPATPATDVYGLGATAWALAAGAPPVGAGAVPPPDVGARLADLLTRCTAPRSDLRPTAALLAEELTRAGRGRSRLLGRRGGPR